MNNFVKRWINGIDMQNERIYKQTCIDTLRAGLVKRHTSKKKINKT